MTHTDARAAVAIVPAAGKGERFRISAGAGEAGGKLLVAIDGEPLLDRTLRALFDANVATVVVVLPPVPRSVYAASRLLDDTRVRAMVNPDPARGMLSSIQTGVAASDGDPILILPADMPFVRADTVSAVLEACARTGRVVSPCFDGRRGHPLGLPGSWRPVILQAGAGATLSTLLTGVERFEIDVADPGILRDVDVVGDLSGAGS